MRGRTISYYIIGKVLGWNRTSVEFFTRFDTNGNACYVPTDGPCYDGYSTSPQPGVRLPARSQCYNGCTINSRSRPGRNSNSRSRSGRNSNNRSCSGRNSAHSVSSASSAPSDEEIQCKEAIPCKVAQLAVASGYTTSQDGTNYSGLLRSQPDVSQLRRTQDNLPLSAVSSIEALFPGASQEGADKAKSSGASRKGATKPITRPEPFLAFPSDQMFKLSDLDWGDDEERFVPW